MTRVRGRVGAGLRLAAQRPLFAIAAVIIAGVSCAVLAAPLIAPYGPLQLNLLHIFASPSAHHLLGTDSLGRDVLSRLLYGGRPALGGVAVAVGVFAITGTSVGVTAGFLGGWVDRLCVALLDVMLSVPGLIVILAVLAVFHDNAIAAMAVLGLFGSANLARVVRSSVIGLRGELFVDSARVSGLAPIRIMTRHILPGLLGLVMIQMALFAGIALVVQTGLGFLGLATPAPAPSWGGMVGEAAPVESLHPWFLYVTGGVIAVMAIAFGLLGDGLRDILADRRHGGGVGRPALARAAVAAASSAPAETDDSLLVVREYTVAFATGSGDRTVVQEVSFEVRDGEIFGLVGESGSGKTVTALSLLGLLPENGAVIGGAAFLDGRLISPAPESVLGTVRGKQIGLVSQEPMVALDPHFTVGAQLTEVIGRISDLPSRGRAARRARALELLASVRLPDPADVLRRYPHELSGGMTQRVVIAMALAGAPRLLLADEPTTALDVTVQAEILDLLRTLRDERGMAIILITHDLGVVADICDRAIVMEKGRLVENGTVDEIFYTPTNPYTRSLIASTPSILGRAHA